MATAELKKGDVKDIGLGRCGQTQDRMGAQQMPVLESIRKRFAKEQPLKGLRVSACLHVTSETANLMIALRDGGADIVLCASNPLSTQDEVAASLNRDFNIPTFAIKGEGQQHLLRAPEGGARAQTAVHHGRWLRPGDHAADQAEGPGAEPDCRHGGNHHRRHSLARDGQDGTLKYPIIAVNDAMTKHFFDNRYGTGQSTLDGVIRATNVLLAGLKVVIAGYGWCGRGAAMRAKGHGSDVIITEIDPVKALKR